MSTTKIFDTSNIVRSLPYKAVAATVDKTYDGVLVDGKKYIKAGTLVAGKDGSIFDDRTKAVVENKTAPEGVVLYDVDLTIENAVSVLYAGEVYKNKVNGGEVSDAVKKALPLIKFISEK